MGVFADLLLTSRRRYVKIHLAFDVERYRSGYNGTVLKTVVPQGTVGSNPTLSATDKTAPCGLAALLVAVGMRGDFFKISVAGFAADNPLPCRIICLNEVTTWRSTQVGDEAPLLRA